MVPVLPPLRLLTVFEAVFRNGSVQRAAAELNVTQPAISQALRQLETHIGVKLLDRSSRPAALTEAGRVLRSATSDGLGRIGGAIEQIRNQHSSDEGSVTVACSVGVATYWLMPQLARFYDEHADISVSVMTTPLGAPLLSAGVDLAIRYGSGKWADGAVTKLFDERVVPVCSEPLKQRLDDEGVDLSRAPLLHVNVEEDEWLSWSHYFRSHGMPANTKKGRQFTNYVQATQAALNGQGVMLGWNSITSGLVGERRLIELDYSPLFPEESFYLVTAHGKEKKEAALLVGIWLSNAARRMFGQPSVR